MIGISPQSARIPAGATRPEDEQATRETIGWTLDEAARTLLDQFDDDGDGSLYDQRILGMRIGTEARTSTTEVTYTLGVLAGRPEYAVVRVRAHTTWTLDRLMKRADVNGDHVAGRTEIHNLLRTYDADGNGRLSAVEFQRARAELGAERGNTWRTVEEVGTRSRYPRPRPTGPNGPGDSPRDRTTNGPGDSPRG
jgi:hypothetical protein